MNSSIKRVVGAVVSALVFAGASVALAGGLVTRLEAGLTSGAALKGKAAYVTESLAGGRTRQKLSVEVQGAVPNTKLPLAVNGGTFATVTTDALGRVKFEVRVGGDDPGAGAGQIPELGVGDIFSAGAASGKFVQR